MFRTTEAHHTGGQKQVAEDYLSVGPEGFGQLYLSVKAYIDFYECRKDSKAISSLIEKCSNHFLRSAKVLTGQRSSEIGSVTVRCLFVRCFHRTRPWSEQVWLPGDEAGRIVLHSSSAWCRLPGALIRR